MRNHFVLIPLILFCFGANSQENQKLKPLANKYLEDQFYIGFV